MTKVDRDKRMKASDVYRQSPFMQGSWKRFEQAFPQIDNILMEVREDNAVKIGESSVRTYTINDFPGVVDCSNPLCCGGGFSMEPILHDMVRKGQTEYKFSEKCDGYEGSPQGVKRYGDCYHFFDVKVSITYKSVQHP
jgi:hypothetical protein